MNDPFAMRPFFGYNFGHYLAHWLSMSERSHTLPKIFHVNWFRKSSSGGFLWPGFGENVRVLDWVLRRVEGEPCARRSAVGWLPAEGALRLDGLTPRPDLEQLFSLPGPFWRREVEEVGSYFADQVGEDLPNQIANQLDALRRRVADLA